MWYVLAAANALSGDADLIAGTQLKVPEMAASKNDATSFRPYNPGEIVGSTSPGLPYIPPAASNGCGYIIALVVIIAVSIFVPYLAPVLQGPLGVGLTAAKAIATGIVTFGAHAVSSAIGSASGMTTFSWRNSAAQGIAAGLTAGLAGKLGSTAELAKSFAKTPTMMGAAKIAASAVGGAMTSYAGNKIAGVQGTSFSWKAVAAGAVANVVTASIGNALNLTPKYENGVLSTGNFGTDFAYSAIGGVVNLHTRRQFGFDDKVDYGAIAMDAFGNALGNAIGGQINDALSIRNMNPEQRQSYESSRAGGFSKGQSIAYAMDTGGLRSMGNEWFGLGGADSEYKPTLMTPQFDWLQGVEPANGIKPNLEMAYKAMLAANNALVEAKAFKVYKSQAAAEDVWAKVVGPLQDQYNVELASYIYHGKNGFVLGLPYSSGNKEAVIGLEDVVDYDINGLKQIGFIHTHPDDGKPFFSAAELKIDINFNRFTDVGTWNYDGDLRFAVELKLDAALVHRGIVYRFDYQSLTSRLDSARTTPTTADDYVKLGTLVTPKDLTRSKYEIINQGPPKK